MLASPGVPAVWLLISPTHRVDAVVVGSQQLSVAASKHHNRRRWLSIYIMYFTMFLSAVSKSAYTYTFACTRLCSHKYTPDCQSVQVC